MRRLLIIALLYALSLMAQDPRGRISGRVTDASGALVAGATIRATNVETNVSISAVSNTEGNYEIPYLLPGVYKVAAELQGFKTWTQSDLELRMGDSLQVDVRLELGNMAQSVEVTAEAPLLESTTGSVAQVVDSKQLSDLPLRGGSLAAVFAMAGGVVLDTLPYDGPWNVDQASSISITGSGSNGVDFNADGISNNSYSGKLAFVPPSDMVREVRIETNTYDASVGHTMGGSVNVSLKSGTNRFHATVGATDSPGPLLTRNFFTNKFIFDPNTGPITPQKIKENTPEVSWMRYSAVVGGPLTIPKVYNGRNKTFWIFGLQVHNRRRPITSHNTVPLAAERSGDFSALLALGPQYQVYDPLTATRIDNSRYSRQPFPGNIIPAERIDPIARKVVGYFPLPNTPGKADGQDNYFRVRPETQNLYQPEGRIDHNFSEKHRMFARYTHSDFTGHFDQWIAGSGVRGRYRQRPHRGVAIDNVFVFGRKVLDVRYGFTWFRERQWFDNSGWDLTQFGFPKQLIQQMDPKGIVFPEIAVSGLLALGQDGGFKQTNYSHSALAVLNWVHGKHGLKAGFDFRTMVDNTKTYGNVAPHMDFGSNFTHGPNDNSADGPGHGQDLASLLLGIPTDGYADINDSRADLSRLYGAFLQDDWRVSRKLTVNLGLRYEYESPVTERYNRSSRDFDFHTVNPIQSAAEAQYANSPIPQLPALRTIGGLTFVGVDGKPRGVRDPYWVAFMPRVGFAYRLRSRIVLRGGYGIYFAPVGADFTTVQQPGFNQRTTLVPTLDRGMSFAASISNPFPDGLATPRRAVGGLTTYLGRTPGFFSSDGRRAYNQRWSYTVQFQPARQTVLEIGYLGSRAVRQRVSTDFDAIPRQYLSTSPVRDPSVINLLTASANNPFFGVDGFQASTYYTARTINRSQLLRPYPHFQGLSTGLPAGFSWYHALTLRLERRFGRGLQLQANFTHSRTMEALNYLNPTDSAPEHVVSNLDRPNRLVTSAIYELPFGKGKPIARSARGFLSEVIGGWQVQSIYQIQTGPPLSFGNVLYYGLIGDIPLPADKRSPDRWFNTSGFETQTGRQLANNIRTFPSCLSGVRAGGINVLDVSTFKNFAIREGLKLQLRGEAEGVANHPNFSPPNTSPTNAAFGTVTRTQTQQEERRISIGLKLIF